MAPGLAHSVAINFMKTIILCLPVIFTNDCLAWFCRYKNRSDSATTVFLTELVEILLSYGNVYHPDQFQRRVLLSNYVVDLSWTTMMESGVELFRNTAEQRWNEFPGHRQCESKMKISTNDYQLTIITRMPIP